MSTKSLLTRVLMSPVLQSAKRSNSCSSRFGCLHYMVGVTKFKLLNMYIFIYTYVHTDMPEGLEQGFRVY